MSENIRGLPAIVLTIYNILVKVVLQDSSKRKSNKSRFQDRLIGFLSRTGLSISPHSETKGIVIELGVAPLICT